MPNANSVPSSSSNNQNMEMNQGSVRRFAGGDIISARELYNRIGNQNMEINQGSIARELYNYFNNQNMEMNQGSVSRFAGGVQGHTGPTGAQDHTGSTGFGVTGATRVGATGVGVTGATGDRIYGRELRNRNRNSNQHTVTNNEIDERNNRMMNDSMNRIYELVRMDNTPPICVISNPPYPNNSESSRRE